MTEKRFTIKTQDDYWAVVDNYNEDKVCIINGIHTEIEAIWLCDFMNEQQATINKKKELLKLIANACSFNKEHSVKEILRNQIKGIDTVTSESANAWKDYVLLSEFFEECYGENWDNE